VGKHRQQEQPAQPHQKGDLVKFIAVVCYRSTGPDGIVDDPLGQFQSEVQQGEQSERDRKQDQLIALGIFPNELKQGTFYDQGPDKLVWVIAAKKRQREILNKFKGAKSIELQLSFIALGSAFKGDLP
jgi:hypothetical protein